MVNYKRVVCEAAVLCALLIFRCGVEAAPAPAECDQHFDQRQNGTENYRLNIDGVVIAVAPAESLLAAASDFDLSDLLDLEDFSEFTQKPPKPQQPSTAAPAPAPAEQTLLQSSEQPILSSTEAGAKKSDVKAEKKEAAKKKQEKAQRLKMRLANILVPLLRRNRHH